MREKERKKRKIQKASQSRLIISATLLNSPPEEGTVGPPEKWPLLVLSGIHIVLLWGALPSTVAPVRSQYQVLGFPCIVKGIATLSSRGLNNGGRTDTPGFPTEPMKCL